MTANCKYNKLTALLCAVLAVFMMMTVLVVPAFADEEPTAAENETEAAAATEAATTADAADTTAVTTADKETETKSAEELKEQKTRGIINLVVGAVILIAIVVLAIVFRAKIPVWFKALKSECGKIVWCPKDKLKKNSFVVIVIIVILAVLIGLLDYAFSEGIILLGKVI